MMTPWLWMIGLGFTGLVVGSFFNRPVCRFLQQESPVQPPSGSSRHLALRPPFLLLEGGTAGLFLLAGWRYGFSGETLVGVILAAFLLPLAVIDLKTLLLPDALTIPLLGVMVACRWWIGPEPWGWYVMGGVLGGGMLFLLAWASPVLFGKEGMGMGDVKLMAGIGAAVGPYGTVLALFFASIIGIVFGIVFRRTVSQRRDEPMGPEAVQTEGAFPFGPALALGGFIAYLFGEPIWWFYLSLLA